MTRRLVPLVVALACLLAACTGESASGSEEAATPSSSTTATTAAAVTPSTVPQLPAAPTSGTVRAIQTSTGVIAPVLAEEGGGAFRVGTPCGEEAVVRGATPLF